MNKRLLKKKYKWRWHPSSLVTEDRFRKRLREFGDEKDSWISTLHVGDKIVDCRYRVCAIKKLDLRNDHLITDDDHGCSPRSCCDEALQDWPIGHKLTDEEIALYEPDYISYKP